MKIYRCARCGAKYDFATMREGRFCELCGAPVAYRGEEPSAWHDNPHLKDYDAQGAV